MQTTDLMASALASCPLKGLQLTVVHLLFICSLLYAIIRSRRFSTFGHDADAKMILMVPPPDNWKIPPGHPRITWLNTVQRDLRAYNLTLNEAVSLAQNRCLRRLMFVCCYALLVVHARKEEVEYDTGIGEPV